MKIRDSLVGHGRLALVLGFALVSLLVLAWMWSFTGVEVPFFTSDRDYAVSADVDTVRNLVPFADVETAGVRVGVVETITPAPGAASARRLELRLDDVAVPLHQGASIRVSEKSLAGQYYVDLVDGTGPALPSGTVLPPAGVRPSVDLRDVLASVDTPTRGALGSVIRSAGTATAGRRQDVARLVDGLARIGDHGGDALDALSAQSADLTRLSAELDTVFSSVDTDRGQIAQVVRDANRVTAATAGQRQALQGSVERLPGLLASTRTASDDLTGLSGKLAPVASDLQRAAPDLGIALQELPVVTAELRGLLPDLKGTLDASPATLDRVPATGADVRAFVGPATDLLRDLNPALRYLRPYGPEAGQFFANFAAGMDHPTTDGQIYIPLQAVENPGALQPDPLTLPPGIITGENAYPAPGSLANRQPQGPFPHIDRDGG
ncbi:MlaD family protein [Actinomycetospora sp. TBRC 11914]|uniref:MlaD family protein n=1 Tax=Actinomycetospora sp. TBRC 11914 TaxID=2729387 RepID=UPI00145F3B02|nr:MlaD family protein [Actinomycetospora sp. TBRC 11914]NMO91482.1 MCE family protein [Actinomycetospora sp. TBRC 11914]